MAKLLTEGLKYMDMKNQMFQTVGIDEFKSSVGDDDDLITLSFTVKAKAVAEDLAEWFERGYDWVVDADTSPGEVAPGKWIVFVEMNRRIRGAEQIMEMLDDLETLTGFKEQDWRVKIGDQVEPASVKFIKDNLDLSPQAYRAAHEEPLNEWRQIAGIPTVKTYDDDEAIKAIKRQAGIF